MESIFDGSVILSIVGELVIITNIVVQVLKKLTWNKLPTNILAVLIAMVLTLVAFFVYCEVQGVAIVWYTVVAAVVLGFFVAYAAMFGFDKLKEAITQFGETENDNRIEEISELVSMNNAELKAKAEELGADIEGLTLKKDIAAAIIAAILK